MAKCLRCGAGNEWIQGKVKNECHDSDLNAVLGDVRAKLNEKAFTTPDANWVIEVDDVIDILSEHFS